MKRYEDVDKDDDEGDAEGVVQEDPSSSVLPSSEGIVQNEDKMGKEGDETIVEEEEEDFVPEGGVAEVDDETTLEAEERLGREVSYEEELRQLNEDGDLPIEKLREQYAKIPRVRLWLIRTI